MQGAGCPARPAGSRHPPQDCQVLQDISQLAAGLYCRVHSPRVQDKVVMPPFDVEVPPGLTYPEYIWCVLYFDPEILHIGEQVWTGRPRPPARPGVRPQRSQPHTRRGWREKQCNTLLTAPHCRWPPWRCGSPPPCSPPAPPAPSWPASSPTVQSNRTETRLCCPSYGR